MNILGLSAYYHDSAACLLMSGEVKAAAQEERFTRRKHDSDFPRRAVEFCLRSNALQMSDIDYVVIYDKPVLQFERLVDSYVATSREDIGHYASSLPLWMKHKLWMPENVRETLNYSGELLFTQHHQCHAGSAFYPSPFQEAAILTVDGVGEWTSNGMGYGHDNKFELTHEVKYPHSLGMLYSAFTYFTGFKVNSGEYNVMGLAPYGNPRFVDTIYNSLIDVREDGTFRLNLRYFNTQAGPILTSDEFAELFEGPRRKPDSPIAQREMDLAASVQKVTQECIARQVELLAKETGSKNLVVAGEVAMNCMGRGDLLRGGSFEKVWLQPVSGDLGGALGAALCVWFGMLDNPRNVVVGRDSQKQLLLGPAFAEEEVLADLHNFSPRYHVTESSVLCAKVAELLSTGKIVGWFQGNMEFGPRALGNRSILADARAKGMLSELSLKVKHRESLRPFGLAIMNEMASEYFDLTEESPYMVLTIPLSPHKRIEMTEEQQRLFGLAKLNVPRSEIPAVTHVDYSVRVQTVAKESHPLFHSLLSAFYELTGCPGLINTSLNVRGEPIVCSPSDAYRCFMNTSMDCLVINNLFFFKDEQPVWHGDVPESNEV